MCVERGDLDPSVVIQPLPDGPFEMVELMRDVLPRVIGLAWHRDRRCSRPMETFVELARELCTGLDRSRAAAAAAG